MRDFLYLEDDVVRINEQAMTLPETKAIWGMDKRRHKKYFQKIITYTYYMYHRDSIYRNLDISDRRKKIMSTYFPDSRKHDEIESDYRVQAFINIYNELSKTQKERIRDSMIKDLEQMADHLSKIEFQKKIDETHTIMVKCPEKGEEIPVDVKVKKIIDNSQEKLKAMKLIEETMDREEAIKKKIEKERLMEGLQGQTNRRMFDK